MSRTKVKQNVIDVSPGGILEQIIYRADGRTITTKQGNITVPTAAYQTSTTSHVLISGSNIDYVPPTGATAVYYEIALQGHHIDANPLYHFKIQVDNSSGTLTDVPNSRRSYYSPDLRDFKLSIETYIRINGTEDVANEQVGTWTSARTIQATMRSYSTSFDFGINRLYHWDGSNQNLLSLPLIKITAYS